MRTFETSGGNMRYVVRDADGNEYTTFREAIGEAARRAGRRARSRTTRPSAVSTRTSTWTKSNRSRTKPMAATVTPTPTRPPGAPPRGGALAGRAVGAARGGRARRAVRQAAAVQGQGRRGHQGRRPVSALRTRRRPSRSDCFAASTMVLNAPFWLKSPPGTPSVWLSSPARSRERRNATGSCAASGRRQSVGRIALGWTGEAIEPGATARPGRPHS